MFDKILSTPLQQKDLSYENIILKENEELKLRYIMYLKCICSFSSIDLFSLLILSKLETK